jgi:hypothetical protein
MGFEGNPQGVWMLVTGMVDVWLLDGCWYGVTRYIGPRPYANLYCPYRASITLKGFNNLAQGLAPGNQSAAPGNQFAPPVYIRYG